MGRYNVNIMASESRKAQWRQSRRLARDRARREGRCIGCLQTAVKKPRVTCASCGERANAAKRRRAQRLRSSALARAGSFGIDLGLLLRNLRMSPQERFASLVRTLHDARTFAKIARSKAS